MSATSPGLIVEATAGPLRTPRCRGANRCWASPTSGGGGSAAGPTEASVHLSPTASARHRAQVMQDLLEAAPLVTLEVSRQDTALVDRGERLSGGQRALARPAVAGPRRPVRPGSLRRAGGYTVRSVDVADANDVDERVEVHRRSWAPARIKRLVGLEVTGAEQGSSYSMAKHRAVMATPVYRRALDLVAVAPDGSFAAYGLGWLDERHRSVLFESIGTDPAHGGRGPPRHGRVRAAAAPGA